MSTAQSEERPRIPIRLRDGAIAELSPVSPDDRALIVEGFSLLSLESRFARFGSGIGHLSDGELRYLTEIDQVSHVAWGGIVDDEPAGIGRYILGEGSDCAEIAITVVDRFQRLGLGRALLDALVASARANDIETLCFSIQPSNRRVLRMIRGVDLSLDEEDGMVVGTISLTDVGPIEGEADLVALLDRYRAERPGV